ncbi:MAG: pilin [Candidatus Saccharimonadales bacterium]
MSYFEPLLNTFAAVCPSTSNFLGFPNWYRGLECDGGQVVFQDINNLWVVVANVMDITIRLAGLLAVIFIIFGGIRYITSGGSSSAVESAKKILLNALIGLVIAILASTLVGFVAGLF